MAIPVTCQECSKRVRVPDEFAGKRARCECGATFRVPRLTPSRSTPVGQRRRLLSDATISEVLEELRRRGFHGVFAQIDVVEFDVDNLADLVDAGDKLTHGIEVYVTEELSSDHHTGLLRQLADGLEHVADPNASEHSDSYYEPFGLKGDLLGLSLVEFKNKHRREAPGQAQPAPFCSDVAGSFAVPELLYEPWHKTAGVVHARLDYPSENRSPPIAGVATDLLLYQFLDGQLYQILGLFGTENFPTIAQSLRRKHGTPDHEAVDSSHLSWRRLHSTIELAKGRISPRTPATLRIFMDDAVAEVKRRHRKIAEDV